MRAGAGPATALIAAVAALALAGCGGGGDGARDGKVAGQGVGELIWQGEPTKLNGSKTLPDDRIVGGRVRNDSLRPIELRVKELKLLAADGRRVAAALGFIDYYTHGIFPPSRREDLATPDERDAEDRRLGRLVTIQPGKVVPLTFSWRQPKGSPEPVSLRYPGGELPIP